MEGSVYELERVERVYRTGGGEVRALDGIDLVVGPGEFVAIEGPSGSGKSTLLQLLGALDRPTAGAVRLRGTDLAQQSDRALTDIRCREIGFVFQGFNLIPTLSAAENIEAAMVPLVSGRDERQARAAELLEEVGLSHRAGHLPAILSGGEQQRVAIARALANRPTVVLADEPTGNLDSETSGEIVRTLLTLSEDRGVTVVVVTHAPDVAALARRRIHLRDGRVRDDQLVE